MRLCREAFRERGAWEQAGYFLPDYDWQAMRRATRAQPSWLHFGAGNIFRGFIAALQDKLLCQGLTDRGILAAESFDGEIVDRIYDPYDAMSLTVTLMADGSLRKEVVASIADGLRADSEAGVARLREIFRSPSLQMVSFTVTEKGYSLVDGAGEFLPTVARELEAGPGGCTNVILLATSLLYERYQAGGMPLALVSMDNCSDNGQKLRAGVLEAMGQWRTRGFLDEGFAAWLSREENVSFPLTMIDKITPRPAPEIAALLQTDGLEGMAPIITGKHTYIAPFVNTEAPQYLVVEDRFPNGRPPLEAAGVYMTDAATVNMAERMKVMTCLNPLHTALAIFGCLLGYERIAQEMDDELLRRLVEGIGYKEGLPVVTDPGIICPEDFLREVLTQRLPNHFLPDSPQRIATDTSQKVPIRFGETIRAYGAQEALDVTDLTLIPLTIAGWFRYLLGVDDEGRPMRCSDDPRLEELQAKLSGVRLGKPESVEGVLEPLLSDQTLWRNNLIALGLGDKISSMLAQMLEGPGAVRRTLAAYL